MFSSNSSQVSDEKLYSEDVFSTFVYTGNGSTQTITNGIDLAGKGGMVWAKSRSAAGSNSLYDTARGAGSAGNSKVIFSNSTVAQQTSGFDYVSSFNSNGFSIAFDAAGGNINTNATTYASWTFRKAPKFFDVVTYTGTGTDPLTLNHNLQSVPGCIIIKCTSAATNWRVHSAALNMTLTLNTTNAGFSPDGLIKNLTSTTFQVNNSADVNTAGATYVAYLFAHDTTSDGIIQCGSFTTDGSGNATVNLGWEPQWGLFKRSDSTGNWDIIDNMRGFPSPSNNSTSYLLANTSDPEAQGNREYPTATGFGITGYFASATYVYIAIRRGPMRTPTTGTSVFSPLALNNAAGTVNTTGFPVDLQMIRGRGSGNPVYFMDRLRGVNSTSSTSVASPYLLSTSTSAESSLSDMTRSFSNTGYTTTSQWASVNSIYWNFKRAPGFFDEVCYTGTGANRTVSHNLGVVPELMIVKARNNATSWVVYSQPTAATNYLILNSTAASVSSSTAWNNTAPTSTSFSLGTLDGTNGSSVTFVAYLFASAPGVSKVGTYTGNGSSQTINCGFSGGARFVMIKRTDSTGNWLVGDTARGLVAGNDPLVYMNSDVAEITTLDWLDTDSSGFVVNQDTTSNANVNGATYIYLAVA